MTTKLTLEIDYLDDNTEIITVSKNAWDLDIDSMCDMFCQLLNGAGFSVENIGEIDGDEC